MKPRVKAALAAVLLYGVACNEITYPTPPGPPAPSGPAPTNILLSATPDRLPVSGGTSTVAIRVIASGGVGVGAAKVKVSSTEGALDAAEVATDEGGNASVQWTTAKSGSVIARLGSIVSSVTIPVQEVLPPPSGPRPPAPTPAPAPPLPTPPSPPPSEPPPVVQVTLLAPATVNINEPVTLNAQSTTNPQAGPVTQYRWDFDNGTATSTTTPTATLSAGYPNIGTRTPRVTVTSLSGFTATATATVTVGGPALAVSLAVSPPGPHLASTPLTFTAIVSSPGSVPATLTYEWDFENDGTVDVITTGGASSSPPAPHVYGAIGAKTARVTVRSADGRTATNTIVVVLPDLAVTLDATGVILGSPTTFTASVTGLASGETVTKYEWDFQNDGTVDSTAATNTATHTYPASGTHTAKVTVTTSAGRTVSATRQLVI